MFVIQLTDLAEADIERAFIWWAKNRSLTEAKTWYKEVYRAIETLRVLPERCAVVTETKLSISGARQIAFGIGTRPTHRIIFVIKGGEVVILRIRHHAQDSLELEDLTDQ